jgi:RND family efflux transporter MFP subunit
MGQTLAEITSLELQQTQLELIRADLEVQLLDAALKRIQALGQSESQIIAKRRVLETESQLNAATNRRDSARRMLLTLGLTHDELAQIMETRQPMDALPVRSPIDGVVVRFDKVLGESVGEDELLLEVHDLSRPWVQGFLSEREAARIRLGMPVRVRLVADTSFVADASIVRSTRMVTNDNRTLTVWIAFNESPSQPLEHNLLARISATLHSNTPALAVPRSAIVREGTRAYVFVQKDKAILDRRYVELGRSDDRYVEIEKGLTKGEMVAVQGAAELQTTYASIR